MRMVTCIFENVYVLEDQTRCCANLVVGKEKALVFDTGSGIDNMYAAVREITKLPLLVINSHGHFDHIGGNYQFDTVYMHPDDFAILKDYKPQKIAKWVKELLQGQEELCLPNEFGDWKNICVLDFDTFDLGEMKCEIVPLKGHSKGSIGIWIPKLRLLLSGDALTPVMCLIFQNHLPAEIQYETLKRVQEMDFDFYLTSHHSRCFPKKIIAKLMRCIENSKNGRWYSYQYPYPPYAKGKIYLDSLEEEAVALII